MSNLAALKTHLAEQIALADSISISIPLFMLWESARSHCLTSDDWMASYEELRRELVRETAEDGSTPVYDMLSKCCQDLRDRGSASLRRMTDEEIKADKGCPFYENASARTNLPKLCRQLKVALEVIEERPHDEHCDVIAAAIWNAWSPDQKVGTCNCSKARAIERILEAGV